MDNIFQEFTKLPLVVKAKQWFNFGDHPDVKAVTVPTRTDFPPVPTIDNQVVNPGDWIVQDGIGKAQVVPHDVFIQTHEPVEPVATGHTTDDDLEHHEVPAENPQESNTNV